MTGCAREIPEALITGERPTVGPISEGCVYRRIFKDHVHADGSVHYTAFDKPNTSVNSGQFSEPNDVLLPVYLDAGIAEIGVPEIPTEALDGLERTVSITVVHKPEPANYAHSEVQAATQDRLLKSANKAWIDSSIKMARSARVLREPSLSVQEFRDVRDSRFEFWTELCESVGQPVWATLSPTAST